MSQYGQISAEYYDSSPMFPTTSMYHNSVSPHLLFYPKIGEPRICTQSTPLFHEDLSFRDNFRTETVTVAPLLPPEWVANTPHSFPALYATQRPEYSETPFLVSPNQVDRSSEPVVVKRSPRHPILRPPSAGTDYPNAAESKQHYSRSRTEHSSFVEDSFPLSSDGHCDLRRALARVMASPWKLRNVLEPCQSTLLDFLKYEEDAKRWLCCFWIKGTPCSCSFSKKDQAKNHIRFHIEHLPFSCSSRGICPKDGPTCSRRFCSVEALQKHRGPQKECTNCGKLMLKSNLRRHTATACRNGRHRESNPSSSTLTSLV